MAGNAGNFTACPSFTDRMMASMTVTSISPSPPSDSGSSPASTRSAKWSISPAIWSWAGCFLMVVLPSTAVYEYRSPVNEKAGSMRTSPFVPTTRNSDTLPSPNPQVNVASRSPGNRMTADTSSGTSRNRGSPEAAANPLTSTGSAPKR